MSAAGQHDSGTCRTPGFRERLAAFVVRCPLAERQRIGPHPHRGLLLGGDARRDEERHAQIISLGQQVPVARHQLVGQLADPGDRQARLQIHDAQGIRQSFQVLVQAKQPAAEMCAAAR